MDPEQRKQIEAEGGIVLDYQQPQIEALPLPQVARYILETWAKRQSLPADTQDIGAAILENADVAFTHFASYSHKTIFSVLTAETATKKDVRNLLLMIEAKKRIANGANQLDTINELHQRFE